MVKILLVEDESIVAMDLKLKLKRAGYDVPVVAASSDEVFSSMKNCSPDIILMDINIKGSRDGIEVAEAIRLTSDLPIIFVTGQADRSTIERACRTQASGYMVKPISFPSLHGSIEMALHKNDPGSHQSRETSALDDEDQDIDCFCMR